MPQISGGPHASANGQQVQFKSAQAAYQAIASQGSFVAPGAAGGNNAYAT